MFKKLYKRLKSDRGDSLVSAVFVIPIMFMLIVTAVDFSLYLTNRSQIQSVARDGARTVAIMGGDGTATMGTPIEAKYGQSRATACTGLSGGIASNAFTNNSTPIECNIIRGLNESNGIVNATVKSVNCTPNVTTFIGQRVTCEVQWEYGGIAGSFFSIVRKDNMSVTAGSAESEVKLDQSSLVKR